jgi:hypothetical protein
MRMLRSSLFLSLTVASALVASRDGALAQRSLNSVDELATMNRG